MDLAGCAVFNGHQVTLLRLMNAKAVESRGATVLELFQFGTWLIESSSRISSKVALSLRREESRIANHRGIHRSFQVSVEVCCNSAIVSAERDGYFGLRQSLAGDFDKALASWIENVIEEHGLTEDGKTVPPFSKISVPKCPFF